MAYVSSVFVGRPQSLGAGEGRFFSAIDKRLCERLEVFEDRISGDEVANKVHHGGAFRVLHQFPSEHYSFFRNRHKDASFEFGAFGENLSSVGQLEDEVFIGDLYRIGSVVCSVTEPRKPCATINHQFQVSALALEVQNFVRTGWFYRINAPGEIRAGDEIRLIRKAEKRLSVGDCVRALLVSFDEQKLTVMADHPELSQNWRKPAAEALRTGRLPDGKKRLGL